MSVDKINSGEIVIAALYKFVALKDYRNLQQPLLELCNAQGIKGTLLLAEEGINGTVAGSRTGINNLLEYIKADQRFSGLEYKESCANAFPFYRMKVKLKKEIVSMGMPGINPAEITGQHVSPANWNALISDPEVLVIDTRNHYEYEIGRFKNSLSPHIGSFTEFPGYVKNELIQQKQTKIAMYCTGGIRCEKASALLLDEGFKDVYQLDGGILKYLEQISPEDNMWEGECFVFDSRVAVNQKLEQGSHELCFACRRPLSEKDMHSVEYQRGISCPNCFADITEEKRARLRERQRQVKLAESRGYQHIGIAVKPKVSIADII